jgi:hypothetical protein
MKVYGRSSAILTIHMAEASGRGGPAHGEAILPDLVPSAPSRHEVPPGVHLAACSQPCGWKQLVRTFPEHPDRAVNHVHHYLNEVFTIWVADHVGRQAGRASVVRMRPISEPNSWVKSG